MSRTQTQVIVSQGYQGHRLMYVRLLADAAITRGRRPLLVLDHAAPDSAEFATHLGGLDRSARVITFDGHRSNELWRVLQNEEWDLPIVFPEGDAWLRPLLTSRPLPGKATVLVMRPESQSAGLLMRAAQNAAKRVLRQAVRVLRGHAVFTLTGAMRTSLGRYEVPDPGTMSASPSDGARARDSWNRGFSAAPAFWIGVIGGIGPRKNLDVVAEAVSSLTVNIGLVIAGQAEVEESIIEQWLAPAAEHGAPIVRLAGTLGEHDFDSIIRGLDCVVVAHSNEGPSGILAKAVMAHTVVVAAGAQSLKRDAEFSGGKVVWSELTPDGIASSLTSVLHSAPPEGGPNLDSQQMFADRLLSGRRRRVSWSEKTVGLSEA